MTTTSATPQKVNDVTRAKNRLAHAMRTCNHERRPHILAIGNRWSAVLREYCRIGHARHGALFGDVAHLTLGDAVSHFLGRGFPGKAMVVSIDKATTIRTYLKVQEAWDARLKRNEERLARGKLTADERDLLEQEIAFMRSTDMAVVISQSQNEIATMAKRGIDIRPHRKRMLEERLEDKFKDPQDPFRIAFVCSMWTTGFDVPSLSTIYLDKPLRQQHAGHRVVQWRKNQTRAGNRLSLERSRAN